MTIDPGISQIDKILAKFCPKILALYASIDGNSQDNNSFMRGKKSPFIKTKLHNIKTVQAKTFIKPLFPLFLD